MKKAQEGVLEFLLVNHPLDCPVCDKGGECPLQDQAFSHGPGESRFVEEKRHFEKPIPISDLVLPRPRALHPVRPLHPLRRRGGRRPADPLHPAGATRRRSLTFPDEPFASYFSGNTVQICPVGALTAKPYRFKARPWDLEQTESTCTTCSVGCRITVQSSRDELLRYQGVDSDPVNWGWLCDKGRFDFEAVEQRASGSTDAAGPRRATSWCDERGAWRIDGRSRSAEGRARPTVAGRRWPSSAAPAAPTRTPTPGHGWPTRSIGTANVDAQLGDGLPTRLSWARPGHHRRGGGGDDHRPARPRPQRGAAGPVPARARRGAEAAQPAHRGRPEGARGLTPVRLALRALRAGPAGGGGAVDAGRRPRWPSSSASGQRGRSSSAGPTWPSRPRVHDDGAGRAAGRASPAPRSCRRCAGATSSGRIAGRAHPGRRRH